MVKFTIDPRSSLFIPAGNINKGRPVRDGVYAGEKRAEQRNDKETTQTRMRGH